MAKVVKLVGRIARGIYPTIQTKSAEESVKKGYSDQDWRIGIAREAFRCAEAFLIAKFVNREQGKDTSKEKEK